jgi:hypothetical protein
MQITESDEQSANAIDPIRDSAERVSNATLPSDVHSSKQPSESISTRHGMQIDESDEQDANVNFSIRKSLELASNATRESAWHSEKQRSESI